MLTALSALGDTCYAWVSQKCDGPFYCKACAAEVVLKKGLIRQHHFSHKPPKKCNFGDGESDVHYRAKKGIFEGLKSSARCSYCELEKRVGSVIPDVVANIGGVDVAVEIQKSKMTVEEAIGRTKACYKNGLSVIWIIPSIDELNVYVDGEENVCRVSKWKTFFHMLGFGKLYVWSGDSAFVNVVHFDDFDRYVEETSYYDSCGSEVTHGGYYKTLKTVKSVNMSPYGKINLADDFKVSFRKEYKAKLWTVPACSVWIDAKGPWWK